MKDKFKPYSKNLELVSGNYKLKYSDDDNEVVYAWYCANMLLSINKRIK